MSRLPRSPRHPLMLLLAAGVLCPALAHAAPPAGGDFQIQYWTTNEEGERGRQMTQNDLRGYVNKARCECGQAVSARVRISSTTALDPVQIRTFVGNNCDTGQLGNNIQARPCALVIDDFTNAYTKNIDFSFNPIWLATGISRESESQAINTAIAANECGTQQGDGGVWICVENSDQTDCQPEEFVVTGPQTQVVDPESGTALSLTYDFNPPNVSASNFRASGGDGAVVVNWDNATSADVQGFRALCANLDGSPVEGKGFRLDSVTAINNGTIYYTADNLCPDGPFDEVDVNEDPDEILTTGGDSDTDGDGDGDGDGDSTSTGTAAEFGAAPEVAHGGMVDGCCIADSTCEDIACKASVIAELGECDAEWTEPCAALALDYCQVCGGDGSCCAENETPGCFDEACALSVCATEENLSCCQSNWSAECANLAKESCTVCEGGTSGDGGGGSATSGVTSSSTSGSTTGSGTGTDTDAADTDGLDTSAIESLDWAYVCSGYIAPNASTVRIDGLTNDQDYQVMIVAFDFAGNPIAASEVFTATPRETTDLWEQCDAQGEICGTGGFCSCTQDPTDRGEGWLLFAGLFGLIARRRRRGGAA
ncbi:MAG: MYXO-CTERM sorting domain-containing protein [Myxococcota bacterium]